MNIVSDPEVSLGMNDGDASGGQQVMKSLILLIALMMEESRLGGFVFIDEPFAHLDIFNIDPSPVSCVPPAPSTSSPRRSPTTSTSTTPPP